MMKGEMKLRRRLLWSAPALLFVVVACGQTPEETEKARGVLEGVPFVLAMSVIFVVLAGGAIAAAIVLDRAVKTRQRLAQAPPPEEPVEEPDEVVAGITIRRAPVPRWLYGAYVLIPIFALAYVLSNVAVAPAQQAEETAAPEEGPCTDCEIASVPTIKFDKAELVVAAEEDITVAYTNDDTGVPHTFTVWETEADATGGDPIADSGTIAGTGASTDVEFKAPAAGETLYFNCTIHPPMDGNIVGE